MLCFVNSVTIYVLLSHLNQPGPHGRRSTRSTSILCRGTWIEIPKQDDVKHEPNIYKKPQESGSCTRTHLGLRPARAFERE
ncbi:hypothetical protein HPB50_010572 [Hyalomma asiaticum]|uniref:Uncharacterized protein n=1 Tax=Hyalomma asiaticum TaxID=266040 RepID=A0ACB7T0X6_HYAAI|nr:hypothetical protein HPB50_010572 [Hyalomma asiaticum]